MNYIKLDIGYQEVYQGRVVRYTDFDGNTIELPTGYGGTVVDANPPTPSWASPDPTDAPADAPAPTRVISKLDYMNRFTEQELASIYTTAKTVVAVEVWLEKFRLSEFVDLDDQRTVAGVQALEAVGLIGEGRTAEILGA